MFSKSGNDRTITTIETHSGRSRRKQWQCSPWKTQTVSRKTWRANQSNCPKFGISSDECALANRVKPIERRERRQKKPLLGHAAIFSLSRKFTTQSKFSECIPYDLETRVSVFSTAGERIGQSKEIGFSSQVRQLWQVSAQLYWFN